MNSLAIMIARFVAAIIGRSAIFFGRYRFALPTESVCIGSSDSPSHVAQSFDREVKDGQEELLRLFFCVRLTAVVSRIGVEHEAICFLVVDACTSKPMYFVNSNEILLVAKQRNCFEALQSSVFFIEIRIMPHR